MMLKKSMIAVAFCMATATASNASPITYTFDGTGSVTLAGNAIGSSYSLVFTGDTSMIDTSDVPYYRYYNIVGVFTDGAVSESITANIVLNNDPSYERISFFNSTYDNGLGLTNVAALNGYDLSTSIGPVTGDLNPTLGSGVFSTADGDLQFTTSDSLSFTASVNATPLPAALPLFASGLGGLGLLGWRRKRKSAALAA